MCVALTRFLFLLCFGIVQRESSLSLLLFKKKKKSFFSSLFAIFSQRLSFYVNFSAYTMYHVCYMNIIIFFPSLNIVKYTRTLLKEKIVPNFYTTTTYWQQPITCCWSMIPMRWLFRDDVCTVALPLYTLWTKHSLIVESCFLSRYYAYIT